MMETHSPKENLIANLNFYLMLIKSYAINKAVTELELYFYLILLTEI